eukprot:Clim_evm34s239 gene=Clim_evmTU34s239
MSRLASAWNKAAVLRNIFKERWKPPSYVPQDITLPSRHIPVGKDGIVYGIVNHAEQKKLLNATGQKDLIELCRYISALCTLRWQVQRDQTESLYEWLDPDLPQRKHRTSAKQETSRSEFLGQLDRIVARANYTPMTWREQTKALFSDREDHTAVLGGLRISVDSSKYSFVRVWVRGQTIKHGYKRLVPELRMGSLSSFSYPKLFTFSPMDRTVYDRVVIAFQPRKQETPGRFQRFKTGTMNFIWSLIDTAPQSYSEKNRLDPDFVYIKSFRDISEEELRILLPQVTMKMSRFTSLLLGSTIAITGMSMLNRIGKQVAAFYAVPVLSGYLTLLSLTSFRNRRNAVMVNASDLLYLRNLANNKAAVKVLIARAEDEVAKEAMLLYYTLLAWSSGSAKKQFATMSRSEGLSQVKKDIEVYLEKNEKIKVDFDMTSAMETLYDIGLLSTQPSQGGDVTSMSLLVPSLRDGLQILSEEWKQESRKTVVSETAEEVM